MTVAGSDGKEGVRPEKHLVSKISGMRWKNLKREAEKGLEFLPVFAFADGRMKGTPFSTKNKGRRDFK